MNISSCERDYIVVCFDSGFNVTTTWEPFSNTGLFFPCYERIPKEKITGGHIEKRRRGINFSSFAPLTKGIHDCGSVCLHQTGRAKRTQFWYKVTCVLEAAPTLHRRNRPYSYSRYRTGTNMQLRLMRGVFSNANDINFFLMIFPRMSLTCKLVPV